MFESRELRQGEFKESGQGHLNLWKGLEYEPRQTVCLRELFARKLGAETAYAETAYRETLKKL